MTLGGGRNYEVAGRVEGGSRALVAGEEFVNAVEVGPVTQPLITQQRQRDIPVTPEPVVELAQGK